MLQELYNEKCSIPSDIHEHLPTLKRYAEECDHITEMGVRWVVSTYALLMGKPKKLISYDINPIDSNVIQEMVKNDTDFEFRVANTLNLEIEETDLLFLDTWHAYDQLKAEFSSADDLTRQERLSTTITSVRSVCLEISI